MPSLEIKHCIICEDIRLERRNLASFMGVYGLTPHVGIRIRDFKLPVGFCSIFFGPPIEGEIDVRLELRNPRGTRIEAKTIPEHLELKFSKESAFTFAFRVQANFPIPDTYTLVLSMGGSEFFKDSFGIIRGEPSDFS